jgi:hypothetical protein
MLEPEWHQHHGEASPTPPVSPDRSVFRQSLASGPLTGVSSGAAVHQPGVLIRTRSVHVAGVDSVFGEKIVPKCHSVF